MPGQKHIVAVKPGSADRALRFELPEGDLEKSVREVVEQGLKGEHPRRAARLVEAIQQEMGKDYGITVNGNAVKGTEPIGKYFTQQEVGDQRYQGVEVIVAAKQVAGLYQ